MNLFSNNYTIIPQDTIVVDGHEIYLIINDNRSKITFHFDKIKMDLSPMGGEFTIEEFQFNLKMIGTKYYSGIEVASVRGMKLLLLLGLGYLSSLGYCLWRKK